MTDPKFRCLPASGAIALEQTIAWGYTWVVISPGAVIVSASGQRKADRLRLRAL